MWYVGFRHVYHIYSVLKISLICTHTLTFQNAGHLPVISGGVTGPSGGRLETSTSRLVSRSLHWPSSSELKHKACPIALFQSLLSKICDQSHSLRTSRSSALRWFRFSYILQFLILFSIADSFRFYGSLRRQHWGSVPTKVLVFSLSSNIQDSPIVCTCLKTNKSVQFCISTRLIGLDTQIRFEIPPPWTAGALVAN